MKAFFSYAIVLSLGLAVGFILKGPLNLEDVANIKWLDEITVVLNKASGPAKPAADVLPIDPAAAALIDEELDYRIAQRLASLEGWRSFLAAHGSGAYAQAARAEVQRRLGVATDASAEASAATPTLVPADNEHDYGPSHQLGSLAPYAQPATAKVQRLPLAEKAPGSGDAEASTGASSETRAAGEPTSPVSSPSGDVVPATAAAAVSPDASQDTQPADEPTRPAAPPAGTMSRQGRNSRRSPRRRSAYATRTVSRGLSRGFALTPPATTFSASRMSWAAGSCDRKSLL
jgi:hypothetical protein